MHRFLHDQIELKRLAGLVTVATVLWSFQLQPQAPAAWRWTAVGLFVLPMLGHRYLPSPRLRAAALWLQAAAALVLVWLEPRTGTAPVLLVVVVAQVALLWEPRRVLALAILANLGTFLLLSTAGFKRALLTTLIYAGFHAFAALTAHYARTTELAREALARVNADLLATRALLADSARDAERLRLARELHDVAGHTLTAMRINLRLLLADPDLARREELGVVERLSAELLADLRNVVQSLREDRGLDLETALRALAAPFPRPQLRLQIAPDVRITDPQLAETLLRLVQEALTNAARHADADEVRVRLRHEDAQLRVDIEDDGRRAERIQEGNGIAGMRERLAALRGRLDLGRTPLGGMQLTARLPL
ncbi:sensor histidine kinase [Xanthomonas hyacinthi]|uniref:Sensor histidine kinase n=1 Tax=Xanthomonas hyacinthi TaxID=56455 RepID=A0A2S7EY84_9XANT|nr:sensor histidine kinase [Xanthomonas hyacinthi]KLD74866.1 histidine kinase [Xanthomonas hyacinthi DSM 19077]PPU97995.1 sensor histidine kinase [Xanthomonas hyacinthi]QGY76619.1 sensor histidine kinase [Xanthomonas hyacinthi]